MMRENLRLSWALSVVKAVEFRHFTTQYHPYTQQSMEFYKSFRIFIENPLQMFDFEIVFKCFLLENDFTKLFNLRILQDGPKIPNQIC